MTETEFRRALRLGLGRALRFARIARPFPYRQALLDACVECQTYDPQVDGTLCGFTWDVMESAEERVACRAAVLRSLAQCDDDYHAEKRFGMAALFAADGDAEMRRAMYEHFRPGPRHGEGIGIALVELDGLAGLVFAVGRLGASFDDSGWLVSHAKAELGDREVDEALRPFRSAAAIAPKERKQPVSFEELCAAKTGGVAWGRRAPEEEIARAAAAVAASGGEEPWLLSIFARRPYPLDPAPLIVWAESSDAELSRRAQIALGHLTHPAVRELALRLRDAGLLERNSAPGDHALVLAWLEAAEGDGEVHGIAQDALSFWDRHPHVESASDMLRRVYERTPCTQCRESAVRRMIALHCLDAETADECALDGCEEIRALVA